MIFAYLAPVLAVVSYRLLAQLASIVEYIVCTSAEE